MQAVILAGGLGTRLKPFTDHTPKPMIEINSVPFVSYLIEQVRSWGIKEVLLLLGYKAEKIMSYLGDGTDYGVHITYSVTPIVYDTGARLMSAQTELKDEFLLMYCDNYCPVNYEKAYKQFKDSHHLIQITAYANKDGYTRNNLSVENGLVTVYDKKRIEDNLQAVDIGYAFIRKEVLNDMPDGNVNFEKEVYPKIIEKKRMGVYITEHRYYSIGSWERIELTREFFREKKAVFLDRDGTLNVRPPKACYIEKADEFVWLPKARESIKLLKDNGYLVYLFTNQPGIARGNLTWEILDSIHEKMNEGLAETGTCLDGIYICPHGWDDGCGCRKPKPGLLYQAQKEHSLNLTKCVVVGDDQRDIEAGENADVEKCILVSETYTLWDAVQELTRK